MNLNEYPRVTLPPLPTPGEKDLQKLIQQYNDTIKILFQRDSDKEKRIRELERKVG